MTLDDMATIDIVTELLRRDEVTPAEVAARCGFADVGSLLEWAAQDVTR
ncbi:Uncharacterised protein [Mycobacteroides abscessus subsp. abscessus]|nr:Uncharacterised protein [Mycobacteroides abscessus subsp. abscessus]